MIKKIKRFFCFDLNINNQIIIFLLISALIFWAGCVVAVLR